MKRTPLYDQHVALGGKIVEFAGWDMPVQYSGVIAEHQAVRNSVGLFDVSHMGEIWVTGNEAESALESLTCNRVNGLYDGKAQYSAILNDAGGVIDDIIIYRFSRDRFLLCVNASNAEKDFAWLSKRNSTSAEFTNVSNDFGQIALQGPKAHLVLKQFVPSDRVENLKYFHFLEHEALGTSLIIARTGYTGEDGFEIFVPAAKTAEAWNAFLNAGKIHGILPCGLGARDSLRLESALPLHGHELGEDISALESGLGWIVKFDKGDFVGRNALEQQRTDPPRRLVGFLLDEAGIARHGDSVAEPGSTDAIIGTVTSGTKTPTINVALGMALVKSGFHELNAPLSFVVRGRAIKGHIVKLPFYKRSK